MLVIFITYWLSNMYRSTVRIIYFNTAVPRSQQWINKGYIGIKAFEKGCKLVKYF